MWFLAGQRRVARPLSLPGLVLISVLVTACGTHASHHETAVAIRNYAFSPALLTIAPGDTVTWTNRDGDAHTVTVDPGSPARFASRDLKQGDSFRLTLTKAGTVHYHCAFHPFMTGTITVVAP